MQFFTKNFKLIAIVLLVGYIYLSNVLFGRDNNLSLPSAGSYLTDAQAHLIAENLYNAMASVGTDEKAIFSEFSKIKTTADFGKVSNAFGTRQYSTFWGNVGDPVTSDRLNLVQWLSHELTASEQAALSAKFPHLTIF